MKSFSWSKSFETGLSKVDKQHHHLVNLVNNFCDSTTENHISPDDIEALFKELAAYAQYHFKEEETLMTQVGIDHRHVDSHVRNHKKFLAEVTFLNSAISLDNPDSIRHLRDFLVHWLAYHILGDDQNMARQLKAVQSGVTSKLAYEAEEKEQDNAKEPLITALNDLFEQVSSRNHELVQLNQLLEEKVAKRTNELTDANLRLEELTIHLKELNLHLEDLSLTDTLTGLPNRRHAIRHLASVWKESIQEDLPCVCMMVDVDNFKQVNDTCGHDAGDQVLSVVARTLRHSLRNDDVVCRLGGDEFLVVCPKTDIEGGMYAAELARVTVSELRVLAGGKVWQGSISIGVAAKTPDMVDYEELIKLADRQLYAAKQEGKDRIRVSS